MDEKRMYSMKALDGLRGTAALIVILSHTSNVNFFFLPSLNFSGIGKAGVYLFFILSSFLLTLPLLKIKDKIFTAESMLYYWTRRFFRVFPLYFIYLLTAFVSSLLINYFFGPKTWAIPFQLNLEEFYSHLILQMGKSITWSIAVEFKYYFILPFVAYIIANVFNNRLIVSVSLLVAAIVATFWLYPERHFVDLGVGVGQYIPVFLFGALIAILQYKIQVNNLIITDKVKTVFTVISYCCLFIILLTIPALYSLIIEPVESDFFSKSRLLYSLVWSCLIFTLINSESILTKILSSKFFGFLGKVSFSAYLIHPVFIDLMRHFKFVTPINAWIVLLLTLWFSNITYKFVEEPFMNWSKKLKIKGLLLM